MSFTNDPANSAIDRVRLTVGDIDPNDEALTDEVYQYLLTSNSDDESKAAIEALKYIVAYYAGLVDESAGDLYVKYSSRYNAAKDLLDSILKDPSLSVLKAGKGYFGGIDPVERANNPSPNPFRLGTYNSSKW